MAEDVRARRGCAMHASLRSRGAGERVRFRGGANFSAAQHAPRLSEHGRVPVKVPVADAQEFTRGETAGLSTILVSLTPKSQARFGTLREMRKPEPSVSQAFPEKMSLRGTMYRWFFVHD